MRVAAAIFIGSLVAGPALAQTSTQSNAKPETNCTTPSVTTGSAGEKKSNSMAMEKSAVLPDAGGESGSAAPTVQQGGKPMAVRPDCPPDSKPR
jgi:hypothetical protein